MLPVHWTLERDSRGRCAVWWRGSSGSDLPWGRMVDEEYLRYEVDDRSPATASARGEASTEVHLPGRLLEYTSVLTLASDETGLDYRFRRELRCQGVLIRERAWQRRFPRDGH
jgi:hypothetical protein